MKILKVGRVKQNKPIQATCTHCDTVFEFVPSEIIEHIKDNNRDYYVLECPFIECRLPVIKHIREILIDS